MGRQLATLLMAPAAAALCVVLAGCKTPSTTPTPEASDEAITEEAGEHEHAAEDEGHPSEGEEEVPRDTAMIEGRAAVLKVLETGDEQEKISVIEQVSGLMTAAHKAKARKLLHEILMDEETGPELQAAALAQWIPWAADDAEPALRGAESPHVAVRLAAATVLGATDAETARPVLERLKNDPDSTVQAAAVEALADALMRSEDKAAVEALIADLGDPEGDRSALAGMRLEQAGRSDPALVDRLTEALRTSTRSTQRASLATVIGLSAAGTSPGQERFSANVRRLTRGLAQPTEAYTKPVPTLCQVLETDPDPVAREAAAESLGMIGAAEAATALGRALSDPDEHVRRRAAAALIVVPSEDVKDDLVDAALHDPSAAVRRFSVEAMAGLDPDEAADSVALCLRDHDPEVRRYAAEVLGRIGTQRHTEALLWLFDDTDEDVRWKAVEAVAGFVDPDAKKPLINALWDPSARVALAAERGVHALGIGKRILTKAELGDRRPRGS